MWTKFLINSYWRWRKQYSQFCFCILLIPNLAWWQENISRTDRCIYRWHESDRFTEWWSWEERREKSRRRRKSWKARERGTSSVDSPWIYAKCSAVAATGPVIRRTWSRGPGGGSEVGRQSARKRGGSAIGNRARSLLGLTAPTLASSVSTFRRAHTRGFGIVALIKLARVTSHERWRHSPWFLAVHHESYSPACPTCPSCSLHARLHCGI